MASCLPTLGALNNGGVFNLLEDSMSLPRKTIGAVALSALGLILSLALARAARAAVDPANCTLHAIGSSTYVAVCYDFTAGDQWHLELTCQRGNKIYKAEGSNAYSIANGNTSSQASCGTAENQVALSYAIINVP